MRGIITVILAAFLALGLGACKKEAQEPVPEVIMGTEFRHDADLTVTGQDGKQKAAFEVEIAATEEANMQGLMYRESMARNRGMLFDPEGLSRNPFWMKNTYMPLDIIFIDENSRIMKIAAHTKPFSEDTIDSGGIYRYVLEINAGLSDELGLAIGDKISWQ
jgi:uncharacterized membrane protein (UPF0127 family)